MSQPPSALARPAMQRPAWWLPGPHLPTIYGKLRRKPALPPTARERVPTPDGDVLSIERLRGRDDAPRVIVFHGLEGGLHSTYARGLLRAAARRGWFADLVLWRTCDGEPVNSVRRSYHSGATDDAGVALSHILTADPLRPTALLGVSLGGNIVLKWLGESRADVSPTIRAAVAVSVPFDLDVAAAQTENGVARLYGWFFLHSLKKKMWAKLTRFPDLVDANALARAHSLRTFDDAVTAPLHGFSSARDYYGRSSSLRFLDKVGVPTLLLSAQDDPFVTHGVLEAVRAIARDNAYLECAFPARGGHVGFVSGHTPWMARYWMEDFTLDWIGSQLAGQRE